MKLYAEATTFDEEALDNEFNKKRQNFTSQPTPPYSIGDLWTQGGSGDIMVCRVNKTTGEFAASDWEKASKYTDDHALIEWLNGDYADDIEAIQDQIDAKAQTWYQSERPDITESWTADEKQKHIGDLWYNTTANTTWRYNGTTWIQQNVPNAVFDAIDGKAQIFTGLSTPVDPNEGDLWFKSANDPILTFTGNQWVEYNKYTDDTLASTKIKTFIQASTPTATATGDLWIDTDDNNKMYRWNGSSWVRITDTSALKAFQDGTYTAFVTATNNSLSSKITTYYQSAEPSTHNTGDLWIDTGDGNKLYRWNGSSWVSIRDTGIQSALGAASNAQATADGKIVTFAQASQPTATDRGDLWIDTDDDNKLYRWDGTSWVSMRDGTISEAATKATSYISEIDEDGIFVHEEGQSASPSTGTGVHISDNVSIVRDGVQRTVVDEDGLKVKDENGDEIASFGQDVSLGPSRHPTFRIINSTHMLITEKTQSLNRVAPVNGSTSFSMVLDFDVTTIINVIVDITELKKELGAELVNQTMYLSIDGSQNSYSGAHTVSCSRNGQTVTVTMTNTNRNYKGILRFYEVLYRSNKNLSRMLFGAQPIDSSEYALSIGNGRNTVVTPDWAYESNALGVDWSGNFRDQMSFASLYTNNEQVGTSDANLECKVGNIFGSVFALKEYEWISNEPDAGVTYEIIVKRSGYYHVMLQYTWSSVGNTTSRKRLGPSLNGAYAGFPAFGRDNAWETRSTRSLIYITSGSIIGIRGRSESATSTLHEAQLIIEPAWFL